jgi:hypothetical protein
MNSLQAPNNTTVKGKWTVQNITDGQWLARVPDQEMTNSFLEPAIKGVPRSKRRQAFSALFTTDTKQAIIRQVVAEEEEAAAAVLLTRRANSWSCLLTCGVSASSSWRTGLSCGSGYRSREFQ